MRKKASSCKVLGGGGGGETPLGHLGPAVIRGRLSFVSPFVCSSASRSSCSVVLRIFCCLFFVIYVLSLSGLRFVVSLSVFVLALSLSLSLSSLLFSSLLLSCPVLSCLVVSFSYLVLSGLCVVLGVVWGHFWSSWGSFGVIFGRLGGRFGLLGWSWDALWRSWRLLKRSWDELTPQGGGRFRAAVLGRFLTPS